MTDPMNMKRSPPRKAKKGRPPNSPHPWIDWQSYVHLAMRGLGQRQLATSIQPSTNDHLCLN
jgi:hypothetical protein